MFHLALRSFLLSLALSYASAQEPPKLSESRQKELTAIVGTFRLDRRLLLEDEVVWLKNYIYAVRKDSGDSSNFSDDLLVLGDEEEIERVMQNYPDVTMRTFRQPRLIEFMAPTMFLEEPARYLRQGDIAYAAPNSTAAALDILKIVSLSWELPDQVRSWAEEQHNLARERLDMYDSARGIMRQWWKENEQVVRKREWAAVKPGQRLELPEETNVTPPKLSLSPKPVENVSKPPQEAPQKERRSTAATASESSPQWLWFASGAAAILAVVLGISAARPTLPSKR